VVNVRAALRTPCTDAECGPVLEVRALGADGQVLASRAVRSEDFRTDDTFENVALTFRVDRPHAVRVEVDYTGFGAVVLDYVEVFRQGRQVVLSPVSGVLDGDAELRIEIVDPPDDHMIRLRCDGIALDERFAEMLADGVAREELTDFRRILTAPAGALLEGCADDTQVVVSLLRGFWTMEIREVRYTAEAVPCAYEGEGETRVLVTGFVPFPAGADQHNSSMEAVLGFDPGTVPSARVMRMILPVEFDNAAAIVADAVARCAPEVVVGFGQGRDRVDLESTAYNRRDTSDVFGGLPDNRGLVVEPAPIRAEGPAVFATELPVDVIEADLRDADVAVAQSDDPGRYVCNDIFYSFGTDAGAESRTTGFIHMPYVRHVDAERREELASVVSTVVRRTVQARSGALIRR
jgi:pyroglutamyl-peptidase